MARTIFVGDLHGCKHELLDLLSYVGWVRGDRVVCVGDLVVRGPYPRGTLDLLREIGAESVRGNHEDRLLRWRDAKDTGGIGSATRRAADALRKRHWAWIERLPYWLDVPEHGVRVVHAGLVPGIPIERQDTRTLMYVRCLGRYGEAVEDRVGRALWGEVYDGPPHVVFGHNAQPEPQIHDWATGIDTGCVYGGRLTAMVLRSGEPPPPPEARRDVLVSIPARRRYTGD